VKKILLVPAIVILMLAILVTPVAAAFYSGTPSPSLSPVFGVLVDFDDEATGTPVASDDYVSVGVASITETEGLGTFARYAGTQSSPNYVGTGVGGERGTDANMGWDGTILIELIEPTNRIGIGIANDGGGPETVTIYDAASTLLETYTVPTGINVYVYFERSSPDIKFLEITGDFFAIDDLQFNAMRSPGYWKNHSDAWPVEGITVGGHYYPKAEAIELMKAKSKGDKAYTMFSALVAAKLNVLIGNDPDCYAQTIADADAWMSANVPDMDSHIKVKANSDAWEAGEPLYEALDDFNNGVPCP